VGSWPKLAPRDRGEESRGLLAAACRENIQQGLQEGVAVKGPSQLEACVRVQVSVCGQDEAGAGLRVLGDGRLLGEVSIAEAASIKPVVPLARVISVLAVVAAGEVTGRRVAEVERAARQADKRHAGHGAVDVGATTDLAVRAESSYRGGVGAVGVAVGDAARVTQSGVMASVRRAIARHAEGSHGDVHVRDWQGVSPDADVD
jgi:hypothetical protein